jgi:hypothetical protein
VTRVPRAAFGVGAVEAPLAALCVVEYRQHRDAQREPGDGRGFDEGVHLPALALRVAFEQAEDDGLGFGLVLHAPRETNRRQVFAQLHFELAFREFGDRPVTAGDRVAHDRVLERARCLQRAARQAGHRQARGQLDARERAAADVARGVGSVGGRARRDAVDDVIQPVAERAHAQRGVTVAQVGVELERPGGLRPQVGIAAVDHLVGDLGRGHEIGEVELPDVAEHASLQAMRAERARELQPRLEIRERDGLPCVAAEAEARALHGQPRIERPARVDPPRVADESLRAPLFDREVGVRHRDRRGAGARIEREPHRAVERIERELGAGLEPPVAGAARGRRAQDRLAAHAFERLRELAIALVRGVEVRGAHVAAIVLVRREPGELEVPGARTPLEREPELGGALAFGERCELVLEARARG